MSYTVIHTNILRKMLTECFKISKMAENKHANQNLRNITPAAACAASAADRIRT